jgi:hypothetical protein
VTLPHRGRPRQDAWLRELFEYLSDPAVPRGIEQIAAAMRARSTGTVTKPRVRAGLKALRALGRIDGDGIVIQPELLPAYLFLDVPTRAAGRVNRFVATLRPEAIYRVRAVQLSCNMLIELQVFDLDGLHVLCERARSEGADRASGVLRTRAGRRAA